MKSTYQKPIVLLNEELSEGVYASSGCFTVDAWVQQRPAVGMDYYVIQAKATHDASDNHHSANQVLTLKFNQPVTYYSCYGPSAKCVGGDGTDTLQVAFQYHQNGGPEGIGLADINVKSAAGLEVLDCSLSCDESCAYGHSW